MYFRFFSQYNIRATIISIYLLIIYVEQTITYRPIIRSYKYFLEKYKYWYDQDRPIKVEYTLNDTIDKKEVNFA